MNRLAALLLASLGLALAAPRATGRTSAAYGLAPEVFDGGGGRDASAAYDGTGSVGGVLGAQSSTAYDNAGGYLPQAATTVPTVLLAGANPLTFEAAASFTDPGATASDLEDGTLTPQMTANTVVSNVPGAYSVTWSVTDSGGLTAAATRTVNVVDTTARVVTGPASFTVHATSQTGAMVTFTPTASDVVGVTSLLASPASGSTFPNGTTTVTVTAKDAVNHTGTGQFTVTVTPLTAAESWRYEHFTTAENAGDAADDADPDHDGKVNLLERSFGTDPRDGASGPAALEYGGTFTGGGTIGLRGQPRAMWEPSGNGVDYRALFVRRADYASVGLGYTVEFSSADLAPWQASAVAPSVLADDGTYQVVSVPYPFFVGGKKARFFRVRVSLAP